MAVADPRRPPGRLGKSKSAAEAHASLQSWSPVSTVLDVVMSSAGELPFEPPVAQYISEASLGIRGGYGDLTIQTEQRRGCTIARSGIGTQCTPQVKELIHILSLRVTETAVRALFWICLGVLFGGASPEIVQDFRVDLGEAWNLINIEASRDLPNSGSRKLFDWGMQALPFVFGQVVFRLYYDGFSEDRKHFLDGLLIKVTQVAHYEIVGLHLGVGHLCNERQRIFLRRVVSCPQSSQTDFLMNQRRKVQVESLNEKMCEVALRFPSGLDSSSPIEELQMEHVLLARANRLRRNQKYFESSHMFPLQPPPDLATPVPDDMSVDRYVSMSDGCDRMTEKQLAKHREFLSASDAQYTQHLMSDRFNPKIEQHRGSHNSSPRSGAASLPFLTQNGTEGGTMSAWKVNADSTAVTEVPLASDSRCSRPSRLQHNTLNEANTIDINVADLPRASTSDPTAARARRESLSPKAPKRDARRGSTVGVLAEHKGRLRKVARKVALMNALGGFIADVGEERKKQERQQFFHQKLVFDTLPGELDERELCTSWVSPAFSATMPGRELACPEVENLRLKLTMSTSAAKRAARAPSAPTLLPACSASASSAAGAGLAVDVKRNQKKDTDLGSSHAESLPRLGGCGNTHSAAVGGHAKELGNAVLTIEGHENIERHAIMMRLEAQRVAFKQQSFERYSQKFDLLSGSNKARLAFDENRLRDEENTCLREADALVGGAPKKHIRSEFAEREQERALKRASAARAQTAATRMATTL